jgi:hypothetical protein
LQSLVFVVHVDVELERNHVTRALLVSQGFGRRVAASRRRGALRFKRSTKIPSNQLLKMLRLLVTLLLVAAATAVPTGQPTRQPTGWFLTNKQDLGYPYFIICFLRAQNNLRFSHRVNQQNSPATSQQSSPVISPQVN